MIITPLIYLFAVPFIVGTLIALAFLRTFGIVIASVLVVVPIVWFYGPAIYWKEANRRWAAEQEVIGDRAKLTAGDSIVVSTRSCTAACLSLLLQNAVKSVITGSEMVHDDSGLLQRNPLVEWTLSEDAAVCGRLDVQERMTEITRIQGYKAILAQGICLQATPVTRLPDSYEVEVERISQIGRIRHIWTLSQHKDGGARLIARKPYWYFERPTFPPFFYVKIYYVPSGIGVMKRKVTDGPAELEDFLAFSTNLRVDADPEETGPILVSDHEAAVERAVNSDSRFLQRSGLALICALALAEREKFKDEIALLSNSPDATVRQNARTLAREVRGQHLCRLL